MKTPLSLILVCALALVIPALAAPSTNTTTAAGKISAVKKTSITIAIGKGDTLKSFKITKKTKVKVDGKNARVEDLKAGMDARIKAFELDSNEKDRNKDKDADEIDAQAASATPAGTPDPFAVPPVPKG